jgi:hypothetical protein
MKKRVKCHTEFDSSELTCWRRVEEEMLIVMTLRDVEALFEEKELEDLKLTVMSVGRG